MGKIDKLLNLERYYALGLISKEDYDKEFSHMLEHGIQREIVRSDLNNMKKSLERVLSKSKEFDTRNSTVYECGNGMHPMYYLIDEMTPSDLKSTVLRSEKSNICVCKCLDCGKEIVSNIDSISERLIVDEKSLRSSERYQIARSAYLYYKPFGYDNLKDLVISELQDGKQRRYYVK